MTLWFTINDQWRRVTDEVGDHDPQPYEMPSLRPIALVYAEEMPVL